MARQHGLSLDTFSLKKNWNPKTETIYKSAENGNIGRFDCNICLDSVEDPVVTLCGHLYCWPCIYKWIHNQSQPSETSENEPKCPVCKSHVSEKAMIPLYGPGSTPKPSDTRGENLGIVIPQRPPTPRTPSLQQIQPIYHQRVPQLNRPTNGNHHPSGGMSGEMVYSIMFGNMPYSNSYNLDRNPSPRVRRHINEVDRSLSRLCFFIFCCLVLCLVLF